MSEVSIMARVRKLLEGVDRVGPGNMDNAALNEQLELLIAQASAPYSEIVKIGRAFEAHTTAAVASAQALPTVANVISIWNGEAVGDGRAYVIDRVWALQIASAAAAGQMCAVGCLGQTSVPSLAALAGITPTALNGLTGKDTKAIVSNTNLDATTGVVGNWRVLPGQTGGVRPAITSIPGGFVNCEIGGKIIVPPGRLFAVHTIGDTAALTVLMGIEWHERRLTLG